MSATFEDSGFTVADAQSLMSATLNPAILFAFCHGIHTCIFLVALYYIVQSSNSDRKRNTFAAIITFLWCANTIIMGLMWTLVNENFITHGTSLEAQFSFFYHGDSVLLGSAVAILRIGAVFLADIILIWRCWVLYGGDFKTVAPPVLCLITEIISVCFVLFYSVTRGHVVGDGQADWTLVYYSVTVVTNSLCTFLLLFRIVRISSMGASLKTYHGIFEILIESAAMYTASYTALLVVYTYEFYSPDVRVMTAYNYPLVISYSITGIAPTLIIARVMAGQSRPNDSWTRPSLPHMQSNMRSLTESIRFVAPSSQGTATGHTISNSDTEMHVHGVAEVDREGGEEGAREVKTQSPGDEL